MERFVAIMCVFTIFSLFAGCTSTPSEEDREMKNAALEFSVSKSEGEWKDVLVKRLEMYRSLRDTTVAKFGVLRYQEYDNAYSHFVGCFVANKLGGVRMVARKVAK